MLVYVNCIQRQSFQRFNMASLLYSVLLLPFVAICRHFFRNANRNSFVSFLSACGVGLAVLWLKFLASVPRLHPPIWFQLFGTQMHSIYRHTIVTIASLASYKLITFIWARFFATSPQPFRIRMNADDINEVLFTNHSSTCCLSSSEITYEDPATICSNNNRNCYRRNEFRIIQLINSAQHSILLALYLFTSERLSNAILLAHKRGVRVQWLADTVMAYSTESKVGLFLENGMFRLSRIICHVRIFQFVTQTFRYCCIHKRNLCIINSV